VNDSPDTKDVGTEENATRLVDGIITFTNIGVIVYPSAIAFKVAVPNCNPLIRNEQTLFVVDNVHVDGVVLIIPEGEELKTTGTEVTPPLLF